MQSSGESTTTGISSGSSTVTIFSTATLTQSPASFCFTAPASETTPQSGLNLQTRTAGGSSWLTDWVQWNGWSHLSPADLRGLGFSAA